MKISGSLPMLGIVLALTLSGCQKPTAQTTSEPNVAKAPPPSPSGPAATFAEVKSETVSPPDTSTPISAPAPAPQPELAPPGVFYLIEAVHVERDSGVIGLPPGTGVKLIRDGVYLTPAGELELSPELLTNDLGKARQSRDADRAIQASLKSQSNAEAGAARIFDATAESQSAATQRAALAAMDRRDADARLAGLIEQEANLRSTLTVLHQKHYKETADRFIKRATVTATTEQDINKVQAALNVITAQIDEAQRANRR